MYAYTDHRFDEEEPEIKDKNVLYNVKCYYEFYFICLFIFFLELVVELAL